MNFPKNSTFSRKTTYSTTIARAQFTFDAIFLRKFANFTEKFNNFIGALTKLNVDQNATLKEKNIQYGATSDIRSVSVWMCRR